MIKNIDIVINFSKFFISSIAILSLFLLILTKKFNNKKIRLFGMFLCMNKQKVIVLSTLVLNFLLSSFSLINLNYFNKFYITLLILNSVISIIISFNLHLILSEIIYSSIELLALYLSSLIYSYLYTIHYDINIFYLYITFEIAIFIYICYLNLRKLELLIKK